MAIPLLIDTDLGDDIDDALAIALALRSPEVAIVGVTTVYQCAALRARLAAHLLSAYGQPDIPVAAGADRPLLGAVRADWKPNQAVVLRDDAAGTRRPADERAVDLIVREGLRHSGLVLVPIGPMTNIALALAVEPRLVERVRIVAMAGAWDRGGAEYNVECDPEAVAAVLAAGAQVDFVGLDVTTRVTMRAGDLAALASAEATPERTLLAFLRAWQRGWRRDEMFTPLLHDPLAVAAAFAPDLIRWQEAPVAVELGSPNVRGLTCVPRDGAPRRTRIARGVDVEAFLELFGSRVCRSPAKNTPPTGLSGGG